MMEKNSSRATSGSTVLCGKREKEIKEKEEEKKAKRKVQSCNKCSNELFFLSFDHSTWLSYSFPLPSCFPFNHPQFHCNFALNHFK
jgi:hypothetical protein